MSEHEDNSVDVDPAPTEDRPDRMRVSIRSGAERDMAAFIDGVALEEAVMTARAKRDGDA